MLSFIPAKTESISLGEKHLRSPSCTPIFWPRAYSDFSTSPSRARRTREAEKARELRVGVSKLPRDSAKPTDETTAASMVSQRTACGDVRRIAESAVLAWRDCGVPRVHPLQQGARGVPGVCAAFLDTTVHSPTQSVSHYQTPTFRFPDHLITTPHQTPSMETMVHYNTR